MDNTMFLKKGKDILENGGNLILEINNVCDYYDSPFFGNHEWILSTMDFYIFRKFNTMYCYVYNVGIFEM